MKGKVIFVLILLVLVFGTIYAFDAKDYWEKEDVTLEEVVETDGEGGGYNVKLFSEGIG